MGGRARLRAGRGRGAGERARHLLEAAPPGVRPDGRTWGDPAALGAWKARRTAKKRRRGRGARAGGGARLHMQQAAERVLGRHACLAPAPLAIRRLGAGRSALLRGRRAGDPGAVRVRALQQAQRQRRRAWRARALLVPRRLATRAQ